MKENQKNSNLDKILSLSKEEVRKLLSEMTASEIIDLVNCFNEVSE